MTRIHAIRLGLRGLALGVFFAGIAAIALVAPAADHRDGPIFGNTAQFGFQDINDIFIFQAPGNINNTVLVLTFQPFPGNLSPATFDQRMTYDVKIDNNGDIIEDITFRITFGPPDTGGIQAVTVRVLPSSKFPPVGILARGNTGQNIMIRGGGMFRAAIQDDPFFFDAGQFGTFIAAGQGSPVRPVGEARNFFGPNGNTLAAVLEVPTSFLRSSPSNPNVGVWGTSIFNNAQVDRTGRPAINTALIPPIPRNNLTLGERRNAFNAGHPRNDRRDFRSNMISVLQNFYGRPPTEAAGLANFLLPDVLTFNTNTAFTTDPNDANGFPNGRRLRDDVIDLEYGLLTGGAITSDNVPDDNFDKITDGTIRPDMTFRPIAFPYIGPANLPLNGPGTGPNP